MLVSLVDYAAAHNVTPATVRQRIARGLHPDAIKIGRNWVIPKDAEYKPDTCHKNKKEPRD